MKIECGGSTMKKAISIILSLIMVMSVVMPVMATEGEVVETTGIEVLAEVEPTVMPDPTITPEPTTTPDPTSTPEPMPTEVPEITSAIEPTSALTKEPSSTAIPQETKGGAELPIPDIAYLEPYTAEWLDGGGEGEIPGYGFYMDMSNGMARSTRVARGTYGNIQWDFDVVSGTLSVTGKGAVEMKPFPWGEYRNNIEKVTIGAGITTIGSGAFYDCRNLVEVELPTTLTIIKDGAFADCLKLATVNLPEGLQTIGEYAFQRCFEITSINVPSTVTSISPLAFFRCVELKVLTVASNNAIYCAINNLLYSKNKKILVMVPMGIQAETLTIPHGTEVIGNRAFLDLRIKTIVFPNTLKSIETFAFHRAWMITLTIPDSVTTLGYAFAAQCPELKSVKIGNGVKILADSSFYLCKALETVTFSKNTSLIEVEAFLGCEALKNVVLPENLEKIEGSAFEACKSLKSITIPSKTKEIASYAFWNTALTKVVLPNSIDAVSVNAFPLTCQVVYPSDMLDVGGGIHMRVAKLYVDSQKKYDEAFAVLKIVNQERKKAGVSELKMDKDLLEAAMLRADESSIYWNHSRPTGLKCFTASDKMMGENIAVNSQNATGVMTLWMNSTGHKNNILSASYKSIGVGCTIVDGVKYWVQVFGDKAATAVSATSYKNTKKEVAIKTDVYADFYKPTITAGKKKLNIGGTTTLTYRCNNSWTSTTIKAKSVTFTSSDKAVCTVDATGKVTAKGGGTATISAYPKGFSNVKKSVKITVNMPQHFTVKYDANKGKGKMSNTTVVYGKNTALRTNVFARTGYTFSGWNIHRKSDGKWEYVKGSANGWYKKGKQPSGYKLKVYKNKAKLSKTSNKNKDTITAYAIWTANNYKISYNKNGGTGKISATKATYGKNAKLKSNTFKRAKYKFDGWTTYRKSDKKWLYVKGSKTGWYKKDKQPVGYKLKTYKNKAKVKNLTTKANDTIVMYAKWKKK